MIDSTQSATALIFLLTLLFILERRVALRRSRRPLVGRLFVNACVSGLAMTVAMLWVRPVSLAVLEWTSDTPFGLVHIMPIPLAAQFVLSFLLMDLTFYCADHSVLNNLLLPFRRQRDYWRRQDGTPVERDRPPLPERRSRLAAA